MKPIKLMKKVLAVVLCLSLVSISPASGAEGTELNATEQTAALATQNTEQSSQADTTAQVPLNTEQASSQQADTSATVSTEPATQTPSTESVSTEQPNTQTPSTETVSTEQTSTQTVSTEQASTQTTSTEVKTTETSTEQSTEDSKPETVRFHYTSDAVDVVVTTSDDKALPENAQLVVTPVEITADMQTALDAQAAEKQQAIDSASAFDIKFMVDGQEIEPGDTVHVTVTIPQVTAGEDASVYHYVDDSTTVTDMGATVASDGAVDFDTNHFSTYVIVNNGTSTVTLTLQHYYMDGTTAKELYQNDVRSMSVGSKVTNYKKAVNWGIDRVVSVATNGTETQIPDINNIVITSNTTLRVYYSKTAAEAVKTTVDGQATFYDYVVKPQITYKEKKGNDKITVDYPQGSINNTNNYDKLKSATNRLTVGTKGQNFAAGDYYTSFDTKAKYSGNQYDAFLGSSTLNLNICNYGAAGTGIVKGLSEDYSNVLFNDNLNVPDLFSSDAVTGKTVLSGYQLKFQQTADDYALTGVYNGTTNVANAGSDFFPLDKATSNVTDGANNGGHNDFFGMRYDIAFSLGDYVGPLNFNFSGDDDLWVLLDGKVVLDLGGIHDTLSGSVNLWNSLGLAEGTGATTDADKTKSHRLTVLYMERGAGASNCTINYTIPSAVLVDVTNETTNVSFTKTNSAGTGLQYADFKLVNDSDATKIYTATSGADGTVTFPNVKIGTYTMSETAAPDGYVASTSTWKVKVTAANNVVSAGIYLADGTTPLPNNKIINSTQQEIIGTSLNYNKTVSVADWDNRTYNIDLTASAKGDSTVTTPGTADVMMVLDMTGSMDYEIDSNWDAGYTYVGGFSPTALDTNKIYYIYKNYGFRVLKYIDQKWQYYDGTWKAMTNTWESIYAINSRLSALKEASTSFVAGMASVSGDSKVGVSTFSSQDGKLVAQLQTVSSNLISIQKSISILTASGGTYPEYGLDIAKTQLDANSSDGKSKYVVLFTDGQPSATNGEAIAEAAAQRIKDAGYTIITVGVALTQHTTDWLSNKIASQPTLAFSVSTADDLKKVFENLQTTITKNNTITGAQITDVIDSRFELAAGVEQSLVSDGAIVTKNASDGTTTVTWTNQTLPNVKDGTWSKRILVKAKDTYIGGNNVATNVAAGSFISIPAGTLPLPQPKVNVKAEYSVSNANNTIFLGDHISTDSTILNQLFNTGTIKNKAGTTQFTGTNPDNFALSWYTNNTLTTPISLTDMASVYPTDLAQPTTYYLKVLYNAGAPTAESTANSGNHVAGDSSYNVQAVNVNDNTKAYGTYITNVVAGTLKITKDMSKAGSYYRSIQGDPIFTFKVTNLTTKKVFYKTLRFESNGTSLSSTLTGLEKGTYKVEELNTIRYSLSGVSVDTANTNCSYTQVITGDKTVSVALGTGAAAGSVGDKASVVFSNTKNKESRNLTDTDVVKNTFKLNSTLTSTVHADNQ